MNETQFKQRVIDTIRTEYPDAWFKKISDRFQSGIPDIIGCLNGRFFAIELKVPGGRVDRLQTYELERIRKAGGRAIVAYSLDQVRGFLKDLDKDSSGISSACGHQSWPGCPICNPPDTLRKAGQ